MIDNNGVLRITRGKMIEIDLDEDGKAEIVAEPVAESMAELEQRLCGGYTRDQLSAAFSKVVDPDDWRAPIDAEIDASEKAITIEAIKFFTGTEPMVITDLITDRVRITSPGYRMGPAGDH